MDVWFNIVRIYTLLSMQWSCISFRGRVGLRRWIKAPISQGAWVRIPPGTYFFCSFVAFLVETWRRSCVSSHRSFVTSTTPTTEPNQVHEPTHNKPRRSHIRGGFARREEEEGRTETRTERTARRDVPPQAKRPAAGESQGGAGRAGAPLAFTVR